MLVLDDICLCQHAACAQCGFLLGVFCCMQQVLSHVVFQILVQTIGFLLASAEIMAWLLQELPLPEDAAQIILQMMRGSTRIIPGDVVRVQEEFAVFAMVVQGSVAKLHHDRNQMTIQDDLGETMMVARHQVHLVRNCSKIPRRDGSTWQLFKDPNNKLKVFGVACGADGEYLGPWHYQEEGRAEVFHATL